MKTIVFSMFFFGFQGPLSCSGGILPLEGLLRRLERILRALERLLVRFEGILTALEAILADLWPSWGQCGPSLTCQPCLGQIGRVKIRFGRSWARPKVSISHGRSFKKLTVSHDPRLQAILGPSGTVQKPSWSKRTVLAP